MNIRLIGLPHAALALAIVAAGLAAPAGGPVGPAIDRNTIDGGGGISTGGSLALHGTIGQPDAGAVLTGAAFELAGGFWLAGGALPCSGDGDGSGAVEFGDLLLVLSQWGPCPGCTADFTGDDVVDFADLLVVLANWGSCP